MSEVFNIHGKVSADTSPFEQAMDTTAMSVDSSLSAIHASAVSHIANGVVRSFLQATQAANAFGQSIANISAISDANLSILRKQIMGLSDVYGTAVDVTESIYETISSGIRGTEQDYINFVKSAKHTAVSIRADLYDTVNVLTTLLNSYGGSIRDVGKFSDMLFVTVREGKAHGKDLTKTLGLVANTAAEAGVRVEEMMAVIATLSRTQTASQSMIGFNQLLNAIIKPSLEAQAAARKYGIELGLTALRAKGLTGVLEEIKVKTAGDLQALNTIMGPIRAMRAGVALTGRQFDEFVELVKTGSQEIHNGESAFAAFEKQTNTTAQAVENLRVRFDKLQITMGEDLAPVFKLLIGSSDGLMKSFMNRAPWERWIVYISTGSAVVIKLIAGYRKLKDVIGNLNVYLTKANESSTAISASSSNVGGGFSKAANEAGRLAHSVNVSITKAGGLVTKLNNVKKTLSELIASAKQLATNIGKVSTASITLRNRLREATSALSRSVTQIGNLSAGIRKAKTNTTALRDSMNLVANAVAKATKNLADFNKKLDTAVRNATKLQKSLNLGSPTTRSRRSKVQVADAPSEAVSDMTHPATYSSLKHTLDSRRQGTHRSSMTPELAARMRRVVMSDIALPNRAFLPYTTVSPHTSTQYSSLKHVIDSRNQVTHVSSMTPELADRMRSVVGGHMRQAMLADITKQIDSKSFKRLDKSSNAFCNAMDDATKGIKTVPNVATTINKGAIKLASSMSRAGAWLSTTFMKINVAVLIAEAIASIIDAQVTAYQERKQSEQNEAHNYRERKAIYRRGVSDLNLLRDAGKLDEKGYASGLAKIAKFKTQDELDAYIAELKKDAPITEDDIETSRKNRIKTMQKEQAGVKAANALYDFTRTNSRVNLGAAGMDMLVDEFMQTTEGQALVDSYNSTADHAQRLSEAEIRSLLTNTLINNDHYRTIALKQAEKARGKYITYEYMPDGRVYGSLNAKGTQLLSDISAGKVKHNDKVVTVEEFANNPSLRATLLDSYFGDEVTQGLKVEAVTRDEKVAAVNKANEDYYADLYGHKASKAPTYSDLDYIADSFRDTATGSSLTATVEGAINDLQSIKNDTDKAVKDSIEQFNKLSTEAEQQGVDTTKLKAAHREHLRTLGIRVEELKEYERKLLKDANDAIMAEYKSLTDGDVLYNSAEYTEQRSSVLSDIGKFSRSKNEGILGQADSMRLGSLYKLRETLDEQAATDIKQREGLGLLTKADAATESYRNYRRNYTTDLRNIIATPLANKDVIATRNKELAKQSIGAKTALNDMIQAQISDADSKISGGASLTSTYSEAISKLDREYATLKTSRDALLQDILKKQGEVQSRRDAKLAKNASADVSNEEATLSELGYAMKKLTSEYDDSFKMLSNARKDLQTKINSERKKIGMEGIKSMMPVLQDYSKQRDHNNRMSNEAIYHSVNLLSRIAGVRPMAASRGTSFEVANTPLNVKNAQQAQTLISRTLDAYIMSQKYAEANKGQAVVNIYNLLRSNIGKGIIVG